ncbi:MAG TPA: FixH family protein [Polyangiaceae bacterium]|jgi:hypothetical protein|nr:FixH family protein [Polyangiaceae bacterium]
MRERILKISGIAALVLLSNACGGAPPSGSNSFPAQSLLVLNSDSGQARVEVRTAPEQPPTRGNVSMQLSITDATTGAPESGLELSAVPWMPAMGHGTSVTPTIVETSPGVYDLENLVLFMPGTWQIRTDWDASVEHVTPTFDIP